MAGLLKFLSDIGFLTVGNDEKEAAVYGAQNEAYKTIY